MTEYLWYVPAAYLLGSIPFGLLLTWLITREDIRQSGSGNIGATNVSRRAGRFAGLFTLILDAGKGTLAVFLPAYLTGHPVVTGMALFAVVLGHCHSVFLRFHGGKGVATGAGAFFYLSPLSSLAALGVFILTVLIKRYVSLGSCLAAASLPVFLVWIERPNPALVISTVLASCLIIYRHRGNIERIQKGTERRFFLRRKK